MQNPQQQQGVRRMQEQTGKVMPTRIQTEELAIQHMTHPCKRMPIDRVRLCKGPVYRS